jgi:co-chaperonin GroES (HSP10)
MLDYKVKKTEDTVLINTGNWIDTSDIIRCTIKGTKSISYITKALEVHNHSEQYKNGSIRKKDILLLTMVVSEIAPMRSFKLEDDQNYFNCPITQVLGYFKSNKVNYDALTMIYDKLLVEKLDRNSSLLQLPSSNEMIGRVLKVGSTVGRVKVGDIILIKDNVSTPITLGSKQYYGLEEKAVVGIFKDGFRVENIEFINESILMKSYVASELLNSSILIAPDINYEDLDYSDIYNRDLFQIKFLDKKLNEFKKEDIILVKRDFTNYVYLNEEKYHLINGKDWIEAKIEV